MKVSSKIYRGIEYVLLSELPEDQKVGIFQSLHEESLIKILIGETVVDDCIQYRDYEYWFDNVYKNVAAEPVRKGVTVTENIEMIFGKA